MSTLSKGTKIVLLNNAFRTLHDGDEIARVARLPYVTVISNLDSFLRIEESRYTFDGASSHWNLYTENK